MHTNTTRSSSPSTVPIQNAHMSSDGNRSVASRSANSDADAHGYPNIAIEHCALSVDYLKLAFPKRGHTSLSSASHVSFSRSQNPNQSTFPCSDVSRSHGFTSKCVPRGSQMNSTDFFEIDKSENHS